MRFADILKMCFDSLSRRKGRTILTVLGVFIGCTSIIVMVSIGAGMQESYDQMLKNMGDLSIIEVYRGYNQSTGTQTESKLDDKAVESFHEIAGVKAVMPKASLDGYNVGFKAGINGRYTANWVDFAGIDSSALEDMGFELMDGRYPESSDEVVVGQYFAYNFFDTLMPDGRNYVDRYIWDENGNIDVVYENDASHLPQEYSTFASIGWTNTKGIPASPQIWFRRADPKNPQDVDKIVGFMRELYKNAYGTDANLDPDALIRDVERAQKVSPRACTFGCLESGEEVALVYLKTWWEEQPEIGLVGGFCIAGDYRGCGLSGQILGQAISVYRALGKRELCARVAEKNMRAQGFYHKFGFLQRGEYRDENGLHYQMVKPISVE